MGQETFDGKAGAVLSAADTPKAKPEAGTGCSDPRQAERPVRPRYLNE